MPRYALSPARALLRLLFGPVKPLSVPITALSPAASPSLVTHSVDCCLPHAVRTGCMDFSPAIHSLQPIRPWRATAQDLPLFVPPVGRDVPVILPAPVRVLSTEALRAAPAVLVNTLVGPVDSLRSAVVPLALPPIASTEIRSFSVPSILTFTPPAVDVHTLAAHAFLFRRDVRAAAMAVSCVIKDGTERSLRWRVRRRSRDLYRMPIESWSACLEEFRRVKGLSPADLELAGVFPIPGAGVQDLAIDVERQSISFRLGVDTRDRLSLRTLLVARDRSTGALHALVRAPVAPRTRR